MGSELEENLENKGLQGQFAQCSLGPWMGFLSGVLSHVFPGVSRKRLGRPGSRYCLGIQGLTV